MMIFERKNIICVLIAILVLPLMVQAQVLDSIQQQFNRFRQEKLQEKVFLHTDKEFYLAGEICWFKVYDVDAYYHKPIDLSKIAYVEILDQANKAILQAKIALKKGSGSGSWDLPVTLPSGNYKVRAYTSLMKNQGPDYFFEKPLTIVNVNRSFEADSASVKMQAGIRFYPEGGNLVNGIQSKVAFRMFDKNGKGLAGEGTVVNKAGETVSKFSPKALGIGNFLFTPKAGEVYTAKLTLADGTSIQQDLPVPFNEGWVMRLEQASEKQLRVTVISSESQQGDGNAYLFAHARNTMQQALSSSFKNGQAVFLIDKNKLGDGISQLTVFNSERKPICERLYFRFPGKSLDLEIAGNEKNYDQRKKISLQISSGEKGGKPASANMSMAVYLIDSVQGVSDTDISNYFWLSSDLPGVVESPGYYFQQKGIGREEETDNLMLTYGWRRFRWDDVIHNKRPVFEYLPEYAGHIVSGKVTEISTGLPAKDVSCYLSVTGTQTQFRADISDSAGIVRFDLGEFYNDGEVIVQPNGRQDSIYNIEIFKPFSEKYTGSTLPRLSLTTLNMGILNNHFQNLQISNSYTGSQQKQFVYPKVDTSAFYLKPDNTYLLDNFVRFTTMEEVLREYVVPVNVRKRDGEFHLYVFDKTRNVTFDSDPLVLLDGVPVFDINKFMQYDPLKIRKLEVVSRGYYLGSMSFTGIANFSTYSNNLQDFELDPHATVLDYDGLQLQREFYSPDYGTGQQLSNRLPDFRNLLYWNPDVKTNGSGKQEISFYTSDLPGKYVVVLQGISEDGKAGSTVSYFEIKD